ncbi:hypothetical protein GO013_05295 [Pseudodesulfovibrio sp. JC047]|uniref:hypothetical protein n=1 Tax=Pseudodesulfovibrio sp. JC047 TaxID=2683199 RepID=UPI0013D7955A|nr:hypothetical protein [Pseudodesulfovibrio sp. JC047]NDV18834.1 hypothetical protein [Pseudodesulfovibrio sp. JC047]
MMIRPDQIEGVRPEQTQRKDKVHQTGNAFGDILNQEVAREDSPAKTQGAAPPPIMNPLIAAGSVGAVQPTPDTATHVTGKVESILDKWEQYTATLAGPEGGLKSAYSALDEIAGDVAALKNGQTELAPGLKSIVDELETLTATEQFKFNRGDYV